SAACIPVLHHESCAIHHPDPDPCQFESPGFDRAYVLTAPDLATSGRQCRPVQYIVLHEHYRPVPYHTRLSVRPEFGHRHRLPHRRPACLNHPRTERRQNRVADAKLSESRIPRIRPDWDLPDYKSHALALKHRVAAVTG